MDKQRILQIAQMAMELSECCGKITTNIIIGSEYGGGYTASVMIHDLRTGSDCKVYCADGRRYKVHNRIENIEDNNFDAAEARINELMKEVANGSI